MAQAGRPAGKSVTTFPAIGHRDALLIIDVQNDFLPGGTLAVEDGARIIPMINRLQSLPFGRVVATQDWHPRDHVSFTTTTEKGDTGDRWPPHCIAATWGAAFADTLEQAHIGLIVRKGINPGIDSYSAFRDNDGGNETGLSQWLSACGVERVFICGIALEYCVRATARDARRDGFETFVLDAACAAINDDRRGIHHDLRAAGITIADARTLLRDRLKRQPSNTLK
ncbi:nicotinamidase [Novacetimonas cocois]|uniref:nicotinamidase n=1 Tax=Novacetimonas cocois TaxID=1747507 RepID=A0A365Z1D1_9PROT|nr:nicotinamidase [Novacetimonas cocois]